MKQSVTTYHFVLPERQLTVQTNRLPAPRILHVLTTPRAEGTPNLVLDWLSAETGCWQGVLVLNSQPADLTERLRVAADVYEEHNLFQPGYSKFFRIAAVTHSAVRRYRPDVVVCWPTGFANWVCAGAFATGVRRLLVHAGNPTTRGGKNGWLTRYAMWPLALMRAKVVCCSDYVRNSYRAVPAVPRGLFHTVYNGSRAVAVAGRAAAAREGRPQNEPVTAVMVATLEAHKDHATLLRAISVVIKLRPNFRLRLVGDGSLFAVLRRQVADLEIEDAVEFLGTRNDVPEILGRSDLFVFSTTSQEGLGSVLLEALAAGLPVIASDVPACREMLAGGRWGILVPPGDPTAFADEILRWLAGHRGLTPGAAEYARGFTPRRMMREYLDLVGLGTSIPGVGRC